MDKEKNEPHLRCAPSLSRIVVNISINHLLKLSPE